MPDYSLVFLLLNVALGFYNAGTIWAMEIDIFRTWKLVGPKEFHNIQVTHWKKLPYWIFTPVALTLTGGIILVFFHPAGSPAWAIFGNITAQLSVAPPDRDILGQVAGGIEPGRSGSGERISRQNTEDPLDQDFSHQHLCRHFTCLGDHHRSVMGRGVFAPPGTFDHLPFIS